MANFAVSILNNGVPDIVVNGGVITVSDRSNYDTNNETGHAQTNFSTFRKVRFINPDGSIYLFSSLGDGDASTIVANGATLPIVTNYTYTTGDGVYDVQLESIPTWHTQLVYAFIDSPYVYRLGNIYKCLQDATNIAPESNPTYWELVTDESSLPTKYRVTQKFVISCDLQACFCRKIASANCSSANIGCNFNSLGKDKNISDAIRLDLILSGITCAVNDERWSDITNMINLGKKICCCS